MSVERREANVLFVSFQARPAAAACDGCPFRRCCSCLHWVPETRTCLAGQRPGGCPPATDPDDWCGQWEPRPLELVSGRS